MRRPLKTSWSRCKLHPRVRAESKSSFLPRPPPFATATKSVKITTPCRINDFRLTRGAQSRPPPRFKPIKKNLTNLWKKKIQKCRKYGYNIELWYITGLYGNHVFWKPFKCDQTAAHQGAYLRNGLPDFAHLRRYAPMYPSEQLCRVSCLLGQFNLSTQNQKPKISVFSVR